MNYNPLDIAPLVVVGEYNKNALQGRRNWSEPFKNTFIRDNILVLATPVYENADDDTEAQMATPIGTVNLVLNQADMDGLAQSGVEMLGQTGD